jgi:hypothetical protein
MSDKSKTEYPYMASLGQPSPESIVNWWSSGIMPQEFDATNAHPQILTGSGS